MSEFGIFARDIGAKVTMETGKYGKIVKIPVSIGFKNQDKWANEFFDVICFEKLHDVAGRISKGDKIKVSGRVNLTEWTNKAGEKKKSWQILADAITITEGTGKQPEGPPPDFYPDDASDDPPF